MYKICYFIIAIIFLFYSCSTIRTQVEREFRISQSTPVTVVWDEDPLDVGTLIEMKLLKLGIDAVPFEVAKRRVDRRINPSVRINPEWHRSHVAIEWPAAIIINFRYSLVDDLLSPKMYSFECKILDLETERVLAVISFRGGPHNGITPRRAVNRVGEELSQRLRLK